MSFPVDEKNGGKHDDLSSARSFEVNDDSDKASDGTTKLNRQLKNRHIAMIRFVPHFSLLSYYYMLTRFAYLVLEAC